MVMDPAASGLPAAVGHSALRSGYRADIDGLRAIAMGGVVLFHAGFTRFGGGFAGVDVFFVISGFLITSILLDDLQRGTFTLARFYERRARRILPALLAVLLATAVAGFAWLEPDQMEELGASLVAVVTFTSNFYFMQALEGYFAHAAEHTPLLHMWSLAVEEQFYIVFPLALSLVWSFGRRRIAWALAAIALASLALSEAGRRLYPTVNFYLPFTRAWELLIGALLAIRLARGPLDARLPRPVNELLAGVGLLMIVATFMLYTPRTQFPSLRALLPTLGVLLVIAFGGRTRWVYAMLSCKPLVLLGLASYSAYLWHQPVFAFARILHPTHPSTLQMLALIGLTFALALVTWQWVERPFRKATVVPRRPAVALFAGASLAFLAFGIAARPTDGFEKRYDAARLALAATAEPSPLQDACLMEESKGNIKPPQEGCRLLGGRVTWAALGDSHVSEPAYALARKLAVRGEGLLQLTFALCPPALAFESLTKGCSQWMREALAYLETHREIHDVIVGFRHSAYLIGRQQRVYPQLHPLPPEMRTTLPPDEARELYWHSFETLLQRLLDAGKRVYVLYPIPELPKNVGYYVFRGGSSGPPTSLEYYEREHQFVLAKLSRLAWSDQLVAVDPRRALCDGGDCHALIDGTAMYYDDNHLSVAGATRVLAGVVGEESGRRPGGAALTSPQAGEAPRAGDLR